MNQDGRRGPLEVFFLSVWALFTLVLFFCVALLVREMLRSGRDPLAAIRIPSPTAPSAGTDTPAPNTSLGPREIELFFASPDGRTLAREKRAVECGSSTIENCRAALGALIAGPQTGLTPLLPPSAKTRALYMLPDGELVIDFSSEVKMAHARLKSASLEALFAYGVAATVTQDMVQGTESGPVRRVRLLFDGEPQDTFPAHLDVGGAIRMADVDSGFLPGKSQS